MSDNVELFLLFTIGDVEPEVIGPFGSEEERDMEAKAHKEQYGNEDGIFMLDISDYGCLPEVSAYSAGFFMEEEAD